MDRPHHENAPAEPADILTRLTDAQRDAVTHGRGPALVLAAAGSGKTRVITRRIAHLIHNGAPPWTILALTFTNKAAGEMRQRVIAQLIGSGVDESRARSDRRTRGLTITTFHSLCARLLRRYAEIAALPGLKPDYTIYDATDQLAAMKAVINTLGLNTSNWPPRSVLSAVSNAKNELIGPDEYEKNARDYYHKNIAILYKAYTQRLRRAGAVDFDDLLLLTVKMLEERGDIRSELRARWGHLLIDEYQDTNKAQFTLARLLASTDEPGCAGPIGLPGIGEEDDEPDAPPTHIANPNIFVVGDPDQAIYGWRGADIANILDFESHYPSARVIKLGENFRSTAPILAAADTLIKHNTRRRDKPLFTSREGGGAVRVVTCQDERHEAEMISDGFVELREKQNIAWKDMAVFYRTNALSRTVEDALRQAQVPYVIARGTAFFQREEVKNALCYLRVIANSDDDVSLGRIVNTPTRGIGKTTLDRLAGFARTNEVSLFAAMRRAGEGGLDGRALAAINRFVDLIDGWTGSGAFMGADVAGSLRDLAERVVHESGLEAHYKKRAAASDLDSDDQRLDNLGELVSSATAFEQEYDPAGDPAAFDATDGEPTATAPPLLGVLRAYLESVALVADADKVDPEQGAVTLMTLHAAKGLEFDAVAMIGLEEGLLPHSRSMDSHAAMEEERRLAFVGVTRAQTRLMVTTATYRTVRGVHNRTIPSRFLGEMGTEHVSVEDRSIGWTEPDAEQTGPDHRSIADELERVRDARRAISSGRSDSARAQFPVGCHVRHPQFGAGVVVSVIGGQSPRAKINFNAVGPKTLVLEYARLKRMG